MPEITKEYNFQVQLFAAIVILKYHQIKSSKTSWLASSWVLMSHLLHWSPEDEQMPFISHILEPHQVIKNYLYHTF